LNPSRVGARRASALGQSQDLLTKALSKAADGLALASVPAPVASAASLWAAWPRGDGAAYCPPDGPTLVGLGVAAQYRSAGMNRNPALTWVQGLQKRVSRRKDLGLLRILCGCAFSKASVGRGAWKRFAGLRLVLPRWTYVVDGAQASLILAVDRLEGSRPDSKSWSLELERLWAGLQSPPPAMSVPSEPSLEQLSLGRWGSMIEEALGAIRSRRLEKVVLARAALAGTETSWDPACVLDRLTRARGCTAFAFREGDATFLGATPERLVARRGRQVLTDALAGTSSLGDALVELGGPKNLHEHDVVVHEIIRRLQAVSTEVRRGPRLVRRRLHDLVHLLTPIEARLAGDTHVLELALRLHPTPAVSGFPVARAARFIESHEPAPRGWYGGFIGWFDASGQGECSVAIRSGLLRGRRAHLFAGAGIVRGSTAREEYEETALKQRPFLRALGMIT
jgi:salicylate biosynthesis isochorismate synthase